MISCAPWTYCKVAAFFVGNSPARFWTTQYLDSRCTSDTAMYDNVAQQTRKLSSEWSLFFLSVAKICQWICHSWVCVKLTLKSLWYIYGWQRVNSMVPSSPFCLCKLSICWQYWKIRVSWVLICLMTTGPSKDIWCHVWQYSSLCLQITRSNIK